MDTTKDAFADLLRTIEEHTSREQDAVETYRRLAVDFADPVLAEIMHLIAEDEVRHHRVLRQMVTFIQANLSQGSAATSPAQASGLSHAERDACMAVLAAAMRDEHASSRQLRDLARRERDRCGGLLTLLLELMALDSQKHARMLRYVLRQLRVERSSEAGPAPEIEER
jgi:rubrerythrin